MKKKFKCFYKTSYNNKKREQIPSILKYKIKPWSCAKHTYVL